MEILGDSTKQYSVIKTITLELVPDDKTSANIARLGYVEKDIQRKLDYVKAKPILDTFHKNFIEKTLSSLTLDINKLQELYGLVILKNKTDVQKKELLNIEKTLRKVISKRLLDEKKLVLKKDGDIIDIIINDMSIPEVDRREIVKFKGFSTYFTKYTKSRNNMYSPDDKASSISNRIINENFPKFVNNIVIFNKIIDKLPNFIHDIIKEDELGMILQVNSLQELFDVKYFNNTLTQSGINSYNTMIGGYTDSSGVKYKGFNEYINEYNQMNPTDKLPNMVQLYKQILSDNVTPSYIPEEFNSNEQMLDTIVEFYNDISGKLQGIGGILSAIGEYDTTEIVINSKFIDKISQFLFNKYDYISDKIVQDYDSKNMTTKLGSTKKYYTDRDKYLKNKPYYDMSYLDSILSPDNQSVKTYVSNIPKLIDDITNNYNGLKIREFVESLKDFSRVLDVLMPTEIIPSNFYMELEKYKINTKDIDILYNKVRNFVTKKDYSTDKVKLFLGNSGTFLGGFVESKGNTQYGGFLFRSLNDIGEYDYYLGTSTKHSILTNKYITGTGCKYERLDYYQMKSATLYNNSYDGNYPEDKGKFVDIMVKFLSKFPECKKFTTEICDTDPTPSLLFRQIEEKFPKHFEGLLKNSEFIIMNNIVTGKLHDMIKGDGMNRIKKAKEYYDLKFKYFTDVQDVIDKLCNEKVFEYYPVSNEEMEECMNNVDKPLLLFKITNSDLSYAENFINGKRKSRGKDKLYTTYFKALMEGNKDSIDIGTGEIFFRKASIHYDDNILKNGHHHEELKDKFDYPIIKNKRYTEDKFIFNLSLTLNHTSGNPVKINDRINSKIVEAKYEDIHIIGIDRGERNLLYVNVINYSTGAIIEQVSLNNIVNMYGDGNTVTTNYHKLLDDREKARKRQRTEWVAIEDIKELKDGYMSAVIHYIYTKIIQYKNTIVVLEDLNYEMKNSRIKIEKQVYQKFENALIKKLNCLILKGVDKNAVGGVCNPIQLTDKSDKVFSGSQSGILFYVQSHYTSKIDPSTGFVNLFKSIVYENLQKSKDFFNKFESVKFNGDIFEFGFNYEKFTNKASGSRRDWSICTFGDRIETKKNNMGIFESKYIDLTTEFRKILDEYSIKYSGGENVLNSINSINDVEFFKGLYRILKLTLQMRNSISNTNVDYIISPVRDKDGNFYDSRLVDDCKLPTNSDSNGAYNIARKGIMVIDNIKAGTKNPTYISNEEWLKYAQGIK